MKPVTFLKSGAPFGYGYNEGEKGLVKLEDFDDLKSKGVVEGVDMADEAPKAQKREKRASV